MSQGIGQISIGGKSFQIYFLTGNDSTNLPGLANLPSMVDQDHPKPPVHLSTGLQKPVLVTDDTELCFFKGASMSCLVDCTVHCPCSETQLAGSSTEFTQWAGRTGTESPEQTGRNATLAEFYHWIHKTDWHNWDDLRQIWHHSDDTNRHCLHFYPDIRGVPTPQGTFVICPSSLSRPLDPNTANWRTRRCS